MQAFRRLAVKICFNIANAFYALGDALESA